MSGGGREGREEELLRVTTDVLGALLDLSLIHI